jgi:hypothetical protein
MLRIECGLQLEKDVCGGGIYRRCGRLRSAVLVDSMVLPSGRYTVRGGRMLTVFGVGQAADVRKWTVMPVSAMAVEHRVGNGLERVGGPVIDEQEVDTKLC